MTTPRLNSDVYFVPVDGGVCFVTNRGTEVFRGASIYSWVERLAPHLDGRHPLAELTAGLADDRRAMVERTVAALLAKGLARDVAAERPDTLTPEERERYAAEIAYLEPFVDSPGYAFQRYRDSRFLVVGGPVMGGGPVVGALVRALECSGARRVAVGDAPADDAPADVVLHVGDRPVPDLSRRYPGRLVVHVTVVGNEAWIGCGDGESAWSRLRDRDGVPDVTGGPVSRYLAGPAVALLANQAVLAAFRRVTGADKRRLSGPAQVLAHDAAEPAGTLRRLDLATLRTTMHRYHPHPLTLPAAPAGAAELTARVAELRAGDRVEVEAFDRGTATLVDPRLGCFTEVVEDDLAQVPLTVATVRVGPVGFTGAGLTFRDARLRGALRAIAHCGHSCLDPRRTVSGPAGPLVWGYDLAGGRARPVPAARAFAPGDALGVAAGYDWDSAVAAGLLAHCRALTVPPDSAPRLDLDALDLDEETETYRRLLDLAGTAPTVLDVSGPLRVPAVAVCAGGRTVGYACGLDTAAAVREALSQALLASESLPPVRASGATGSPAAPVGIDGVAAALAGTGRIPVAVPLDHDPALVGVLPYLVNVVLVSD